MVLTVGCFFTCGLLRLPPWQREGGPFEAGELRSAFWGVHASGLPEAFHRLAEAKVDPKSEVLLLHDTL